MSKLQKLIKAVERGTAVVDDFHESSLPFEAEDLAYEAFQGSLDAASELHTLILDSGYHAEINACCTRPSVKVVRLNEVLYSREQTTPARAWLVAILKAYKRQQRSE